MRRVARVVWLGFAAFGAFVACAIDLDPPLGASDGPDAESDAPPVVPVEAGRADADAGDGGDAGEPPECTRDGDCPTTHGCLTGRCDTSRGRCEYTVCGGGPCELRACDAVAETCGPPDSTGFHVGTLSVDGNVYCDLPSQCLAIAYPFLYVSIDGVPSAVDISNPADPSPPVQAIAGVDFSPASIVVSGRYTYFVGRPFLAATPGIRIGWLESPREPFNTSFVAASTPSSFPDPNPLAFRAFAAPNEGLYLGVVLTNGSTQYYAGMRAPVRADNAFVIASPAAGGGVPPRVPVASTGDRVLVATGSADTFFLVRKPGLDTISSSGSVRRLAGRAPIEGNSFFAPASGGRVLWSAATSEADASVSRVTLRLLVEGSASGLDGGLPGVDLATYAADSVALGTVATAPGAMVGEDKAVGVAFDESTSGACVRGVRLDGGAWSLTGAERTLGSGPSAVVATLSARGYAYVVEQIAPVDPDPGKLLIHVFAPACGP